MRILLAGATGVIGSRLLPRLLEAGHQVTCLTRSRDRAAGLGASGASAVVADAYDQASVTAAARAARPEVVIHQLTSLPKQINPRKIYRQLADNDRLRVEGTRNLVAAAEAAGARRLIAQSIAFVYAPEGERVVDEAAPLYLRAPGKGFRRMVEAVASLESSVLGARAVTGVVLRYGVFYGPGTVFARGGPFADQVQRRRVPVVGAGAGVYSFIHIDDAASATVAALSHGESGIYNVVDDEPAAVREWLPLYAAALGAKRPMKVPTFLARLGAGAYGVHMMTAQRGASNRKARQELGWQPATPSWRTGFPASLSSA